MIKLLTIHPSYLVSVTTTFSLTPIVEWRRQSRFPAKMKLVHACKSGFTFWFEREIRKRISPPRNPSPEWISIKKSKSGFHGFRFYRSIGKSKKGFAKLLSWTAVFLFLIMRARARARARPLFLRTVFQILFRISQSNGKNENPKQISQRWNPFSDFAFDCKSEIRILKSKSRFPNRTHP